MAGPTVGAVVDGYRFLGGNPNDQGAWEPVASAPKLSAQDRNQLKDARETSSNAAQVLSDLTRFESLNEAEGSGGFNAIPGVGALRGAFDTEVSGMNEITARLAPAQRVPGSGTTSDKDLALYLQAVPSIKRPQGANTAIIDRGREEAVRRQAYADFLDDYASKNGSLIGAERAFRSQNIQGTRQNPFDLSGGGSRNALPRGAYYRDPQGNLRRNDNADRGNPIIEKGRGRASPGRTNSGGFKILSVED